MHVSERETKPSRCNFACDAIQIENNKKPSNEDDVGRQEKYTKKSHQNYSKSCSDKFFSLSLSSPSCISYNHMNFEKYNFFFLNFYARKCIAMFNFIIFLLLVVCQILRINGDEVFFRDNKQ